MTKQQSVLIIQRDESIVSSFILQRCAWERCCYKFKPTMLIKESRARELSKNQPIYMGKPIKTIRVVLFKHVRRRLQE